MFYRKRNKLVRYYGYFFPARPCEDARDLFSLIVSMRAARAGFQLFAVRMETVLTDVRRPQRDFHLYDPSVLFFFFFCNCRVYSELSIELRRFLRFVNIYNVSRNVIDI